MAWFIRAPNTSVSAATAPLDVITRGHHQQSVFKIVIFPLNCLYGLISLQLHCQTLGTKTITVRIRFRKGLRQRGAPATFSAVDATPKSLSTVSTDLLTSPTHNSRHL